MKAGWTETELQGRDREGTQKNWWDWEGRDDTGRGVRKEEDKKRRDKEGVGQA